MKEQQRIKVPADNYGRVYIGLLETKLSSSAKLCYGVMWSFGQESWASVESIGRRMSVTENTVRSAQRELEAAGWIRLIEGSKGRASKTWEMVPPTPQSLNPNPSTIEGLTLQPLNPNKEDKQEVKKEPPGELTLPGVKAPWTSRDGQTLKTLTDTYQAAYLTAKGHPEAKTGHLVSDCNRHIKQGVRALVKLGQEPAFEFTEYRRRLANLPKHSFAAKQDFSLKFFLSHYSEFADGAAALAGRPGQRYFAAPAEKRADGED